MKSTVTVRNSFLKSKKKFGGGNQFVSLLLLLSEFDISLRIGILLLPLSW